MARKLSQSYVVGQLLPTYRPACTEEKKSKKCTKGWNGVPGWQCSVAEACAKCRHDWMRQALLVWVGQRGWTLPEQPLNGGAHHEVLLPQGTPQSNGVSVKS